MTVFTNIYKTGWTSRRCIVAMFVVIFAGETGVMYILPLILPEPINSWKEALIDSTLLTLIVAPIVWLFMVHPLQNVVSQQKSRSEAILRATADGIIVTDDRGIIEFFNVAAERIFGYSYEEIAGQKINLLMPQPYCDQYDSYIQSHLASDVKKIIDIRREVVGIRKDKTTFPMELFVSEIVEGERHLFTGIFIDITSRKTDQDSLQQTTEQLSRFNRLAVGREKKMIELKQEINELLNAVGKESKYKIHSSCDMEWVETSASMREG